MAAAARSLPRCTCGRGAMAFHPGSEPVTADLFDAPLVRGVPTRAWCLKCWPYLKGQANERGGIPPHGARHA